VGGEGDGIVVRVEGEVIDFVEDALQWIVEFHQFDEMGEAERLEEAFGRQGKSRPCRSVGGSASGDQVSEVFEADDGGLGGFSGQCLENRQELRCPGERFSGQRLENVRVLDEELPTGPKAGSPESRERQIFREIRNESLAVSGAVGSVLLELKNPCPDDPVAHGQGAVRHRGHPFSQGGVKVPDAVNEVGKLHGVRSS